MLTDWPTHYCPSVVEVVDRLRNERPLTHCERRQILAAVPPACRFMDGTELHRDAMTAALLPYLQGHQHGALVDQYGRPTYARVVIDVEAAPREERAFQARKHAAARRMRAAGIRGTSIAKYLRRGWPSRWTRMVRSEMERLAEDMRLDRIRWRIRQLERDQAEARRLMGHLW